MDDWRDSAACRGKDPVIFFPERGEDVIAAVAVCNACGVRSECLELSR